MNERLAEVRERFRVMIEHLNRIVFWNRNVARYAKMFDEPKYRDKINAAKAIGQLELALFRAEMDVGLYENKQLAISEMLKGGVLPTELNEQVVGVFRKWKLGPQQIKQE